MKSHISRFITYFTCLPIIALAVVTPASALESMDDSELSLTTGEGIGAIVDNLAIHSGDKGDADGFELTIDLNENLGQDQFIFSELRIHKRGTVSGLAGSGGRFGTVNNPIFLGDLRAVDLFTGDASNPNDNTVTSTTVMRSEFPGASLKQLDRSTKTQTNNLSIYAAKLAAFNTELSTVSDEFNFHIRFDDVIAGGPETFRTVADAEGFRFYGTYSDVFSTAGAGLSLAGATGFYIDKLTISAAASTAASRLAAANAGEYVLTPKASQMTLNGVDIYSVLGTKDQPLTLKSVQVNGKNQLQIEISPLPSSIGIADKGDIFIKSVYFGEQYNPAMRTGLRSGKADDGTPENYHYAFQPDIGNTIEIRGMSIQHLRITTMDI